MAIGFTKRREPPRRPQHVLWTLSKGVHSVRAAVRQVPNGTELLLFHDGEILWSRIMRDSRYAGVMADEERKDWEAHGYRACQVCCGGGWCCEDHETQLVGHLLPDGSACGGAGMPCSQPGCPDSGRRDFDYLIASTSDD